MGAMANNSAASYVGWEEAVVSSEKERRKVHYYLKRSGGGRDLVVVGKEKSATHISYRYSIKDNTFLLSVLNRSSRLKLRSRRDVIDWLNSIISGDQPNDSHRQSRGGLDNKVDTNIIKDVQKQKLGQNFMWIGSSWMCRKKRRHYQSFCRNGAVISVQDFVYVLAEEDKRLVAYLEDMYEDTKGNKMVLVRWFHKIDEVGLVLPHNYNDREIFFSLCLQDLSIECIDGLATVLSPQHYEKFITGARFMGLMPFVCHRQFDSDDDIKPFDITRIKGYWKQEILKNTTLLERFDDDLKSRGPRGDAVGCRPNKRIRWSKDCDFPLKSPDRTDTVKTNLQVCSDRTLDSQGDMKMVDSKQDNTKPTKSGLYLTVGSQIEVLSQDSGIKGCWFRALIIKKHKDKVKVEYKDVKDAIDESKNLEEWILPSRLAAPDELGIRLSGRTIVRPTPLFDKGTVSGVLNVGTIVDAWWHDGWWEGIIMKKESEDKLTVYFPGEKKESIFGSSDLRHSKEWFDNSWQTIKEKADLVSAISGTAAVSNMSRGAESIDNRDIAAPISVDDPQKVTKFGESVLDSNGRMPNEFQAVRDLSKDYLVARLQWKSSGKRRRVRSPVHKVQFGTNSNNVETGLQTFEKFLVNSSLKFDQEKCKYASDSHFNSSAVSSLTNLVMSR